MKISVGSRQSPLAIKQVEEILSLCQASGVSFECDRFTFDTQGDKDQSTPLTNQIADNFFTDTLDQALINSDIDIAIHSAKDLPQQLHPELRLFALTKAEDTTDSWVSHTAWDQLKKGSKVGTSSHLRQNMIKDLRPELECVDIRGTIEQRIELIEKGEVNGVIVATCALKRLGLDDQIKDILPWEGSPLQGQLAIVGRKKDVAIKKLFSSIDVRQNYGEVTLVGAGPGDPELITIKAIKALEQADVVFYDYLLDKSLLRYAPKAQKIYVGKRKGEHSLKQSELSKLLKEHAFAGQRIVRLKGGDPFIFGRGAEELEYLKSFYIKASVIPGVSSATGIPSSLGIPLTARGLSSSVAFLSGHGVAEKSNDPQPIHIPKVDTLVFLMGLSKLNQIIDTLRDENWSDETPIMIISKGTRKSERIINGTIATIIDVIRDEELAPPALIIVGKTISFWNNNQNNDTVLYCGTNPEKYEPLGNIIHWPMIEISRKDLTTKEQKDFVDHFLASDYVILTSRFAVYYFIELTEGVSNKLLEKEYFVIGEETARTLEDHGIIPNIIAQTETSQGLFADITTYCDVQGKHFLFPRSSISNPYLANELTKRGADVEEYPIYENKKPEKKNLPDEAIDKIVFTSPSTVQNFCQDYGTIPDYWDILAKGPRTQEELKKHGYASQTISIQI